MTTHKTWKILPRAPENFYKKFPEYSKTVLNLIYHRVGKNPKAIAEFFNPDFDNDIHDPFLFRGMEKAVERILKAVEGKEKIAIFGDYDVDGITSATVLNTVLKNLGARPIVYIPDRSREGYSLNLTAIKYLRSKKVKLIITVDCGIRDVSKIKKAVEWGIDTVLTDHHMPAVSLTSDTAGNILPPAYAIINPKAKKETYPFTELAGVGVAFKLASALIKACLNHIGSRSALKKKFKDGSEKWLLDLVALGTVADMVPLIGENRTLVKYGLLVLSKTRRIGIKSVFSSARLELSSKNPPNTGQISFQIAPRLNAAGRMDHANTSFELLNTDDPKKASELAKELETKNGRRQRLTEKIVKAIEKRIDLKQKIVFEGDPEWPVGILGLAAGKICEKYARPAFVFKEDKKEIRGSIRSISKFKVVPALEQCKDLLLKYGGHDFAGGFVFLPKNKKRLEKRLRQIANKLLREEDLAWETKIDQRIELSEVNWELYEEIKRLEPFGVGNSTPLFLAEKVELFQCQLVGNGNKHLKMWFKSEDTVFEAIGFGKGDKYCMLLPPPYEGGEKKGRLPFLDIVFEIGSDEWNGNKKLQLIVRDLRLSPK